jgi:uncharacterized membrane protein
MRVLWLTLACLSSTSAGAQSIHRFTLPSHEQTCGVAIARDRTIVGDDPGIGMTGQYTPNAFTYKDGVFTHPMPSVPPGIVTFTGINAAHSILVLDFITSGQFTAETQSFLLSQGIVTQITWQGAVNVQADGINDAGTIVGSFEQAASAPYAGFIDRGGRITTLTNPAGQTVPTAIAQNGRLIVGDVETPAGGFSPWIYENGSFTAIAVPGAVDGFASGVTNAGRVSGTYFTDASLTVPHGYFYQNGTVTPFDVPGAVWTELGGMTESGVVTGCYADANGLVHGFYAKP